MKDEVKLKDMTDFLENVYKDIKKQPTLEEELEKERKFINKIKGDNKDEVKELLEHIEILDNTDYILHSDKAKALLDYIINLQEENERLNNIINELEKYLEKIIIDGGTRGSMTFWYRQIYDYLQELKGSNDNG